MSDVPHGDELMSAAGYISRLKDDGKLPGIGAKDEATLCSVPVGLPKAAEATNKLEKVTMRVQVEGKHDLLFWYALVREGGNADWRLADAWRTDAAGRARVELQAP